MILSPLSTILVIFVGNPMTNSTKPIIDEELSKKIATVTSLRPKTILEHLVKHGSITTEEITKLYGYDHAPRAIRDVREEGIPIKTTMVKVNNKRMAKYVFDDSSKIEHNKLGGRQVFSKKFKDLLVSKYGSRCHITLEPYPPKYLQIDHRIPYEVAGESAGDERSPDKFMLLCASAQRQKSWDCEHCLNLLEKKDIGICKTCYWAYPENYSHVAERYERRIDLVFQNEEVSMLQTIEKQAEAQGLTLKQYFLLNQKD